MKTSTNFGWKIYLFLYGLLCIGNTLAVISNEEIIYTYYHVLIHFDDKYLLPYYLNVGSATFSLIALIPLILFTFHKKWLNPRVWQIVFGVRLLLDIFGRSYEYNFFISLQHNDLNLAAIAIFLTIAIMVPSYIATFLYAFHRKKLFPPLVIAS